MNVEEARKFLGVSVGATDEEIETAYQEKVKQYHPDISDEPDAREKFLKLQDAKSLLDKSKNSTREWTRSRGANNRDRTSSNTSSTHSTTSTTNETTSNRGRKRGTTSTTDATWRNQRHRRQNPTANANTKQDQSPSGGKKTESQTDENEKTSLSRLLGIIISFTTSLAIAVFGEQRVDWASSLPTRLEQTYRSLSRPTWCSEQLLLTVASGTVSVRGIPSVTAGIAGGWVITRYLIEVTWVQGAVIAAVIALLAVLTLESDLTPDYHEAQIPPSKAPPVLVLGAMGYLWWTVWLSGYSPGGPLLSLWYCMVIAVYSIPAIIIYSVYLQTYHRNNRWVNIDRKLGLWAEASVILPAYLVTNLLIHLNIYRPVMPATIYPFGEGIEYSGDVFALGGFLLGLVALGWLVGAIGILRIHEIAWKESALLKSAKLGSISTPLIGFPVTAFWAAAGWTLVSQIPGAPGLKTVLLGVPPLGSAYCIAYTWVTRRIA